MTDRADGTGKASRIYWWFTNRDDELLFDTFQKRRSGIRHRQMLKGFLSALAVTPDPPPPDVWLERVWNHNKPPSQRSIPGTRGTKSS